MSELTQAQIDAAQAVFEEWFCEELGLDMDIGEAERIVRRMLTAAMLAKE